MLSTHELWGDPALAMDSFHFTCYLCPFPPLYIRTYIHIASLYLSQKHVLEKKMKVRDFQRKWWEVTA